MVVIGGVERTVWFYFEEGMADSGVALHRHSQGEVGGGRDCDLTEGQHQGEHLGVPVISPNPQHRESDKLLLCEAVSAIARSVKKSFGDPC